MLPRFLSIQNTPKIDFCSYCWYRATYIPARPSFRGVSIISSLWLFGTCCNSACFRRSGGCQERDPGDEPAEPRQPHPAVRCLRVPSRLHPGHGVVSRCSSVSPLSHVSAAELPSSFSCSVQGGELFDRIIDENYNLTELDTVLFIRQICEGLQYMHKMYILHLDLKVTPLIFLDIYVYIPALTFWLAILVSLPLILLFCYISAREYSVCQQSYKQNQNH